MILRADLVESIFGYWPEFADGRVTSFTFDAAGSISMVVSYIDSDLRKCARVGLRFSGVSKVDLSDLLSENVIDALHIPDLGAGIVDIQACHGLSGTFQCTGTEVSDIAPFPYPD
jgi:hypothetical protein